MIRADANKNIGAGHVMRCASVARAFMNRGEHVIFITADHAGDDLIRGMDFEMICLDSDYTDLEAENLQKVILAYKPRLLLVDSYFVTEKYFQDLSGLCELAYVDDVNAGTWKVDYLINYNIFAACLDYSGYDGSKTRLFLGTDYTPLRQEFRGMPAHAIKPVTDVLVSAGGADPKGITEKMMEAVCPRHKDVRFHFVVGALNPRLPKIKSLAAPNTILHINEKNMSGLMQSCDVAVAAAGTTLYELCACGIPTITYTLADNQLLAGKEFADQGIMLNAGDCRNNSGFTEVVEQQLMGLAEDRDKRRQLSACMQKVVDGKGAERIVSAIDI